MNTSQLLWLAVGGVAVWVYMKNQEAKSQNGQPTTQPESQLPDRSVSGIYNRTWGPQRIVHI